MIDTNKEKLISLRQVMQLAWLSRPYTLSTIYRWTVVGLPAKDGSHVTLEVTQEAGRRVTSEEAVRRFFERLSAEPVAPRTDSQSSKAVDRAKAALAAEGI